MVHDPVNRRHPAKTISNSEPSTSNIFVQSPQKLGAKTKTVATVRRNPVKTAGHRSWFFDDSRNRPCPIHG